MFLVPLLFQVLTIIASFLSSESRQYLVDSRYNDTTECLLKSSPPCGSLEYVADNLMVRNNITILITSQLLYMRSVAIFSNITNITIEGNNTYAASIQCDTSNNSIGIQNTGLVFDMSSNIAVRNIKFNNCTRHNASNYVYGLSIQHSHTIMISNISVQHTKGLGLLLINATNSVEISNSNFTDNYRGIFIEKRFVNKTDYIISHVSIMENGRKCNASNCGEIKGGGIHLVYNNSWNNTLLLTNSTFSGNTAIYGGGIFVKVTRNSQNNVVNVTNCEFNKNMANESGGGSDVGFEKVSKEADPHGNTIRFYNCTWYDNKSFNVCGGLSIFTTFTCSVIRKCYSGSNKVIISNCNFKENEGVSVAALKLSPVFSQRKGKIVLTSAEINNCNFTNNRATVKKPILPTGAILLSSKVWVKFTGTNVFSNNLGTGLLLSSTTAVFENSTNIFTNNTAERGAGMYLLKESFIELKGKNHYEFVRNKASFGGGLLVAQTQTYDFRFMDLCFVRGTKPNSSYLFKDNEALIVGSDMFVYNLLPCIRGNNVNVTDLFQQNLFGHFQFLNGFAANQSVTTTPCSLHASRMIHVAPGKETTLDIKQYDQLDHEMNNFFSVVVELNDTNHSSTIELKSHRIATSNASIRIIGEPGAMGTITIESIRRTTKPITVQVIMDDCYPGFVYDSHTKACYCSDTTKTNELSAIFHCVRDDYALLEVGHWAGYVNNSRTFAVGACLSYFCTFSSAQMEMGHLKMSSDKRELEKYTCAKNRVGVLCSQCVEGTSVYYNSPIYSCSKNKQCHVGFIYFILVEIIPTTILFLLLLFFNVNLTTGAVYTLIFYVQILDALSFDDYGKLELHNAVKIPLIILRAVYGIANLRFVRHKSLSFCIWEGATMMDIIILKYAVAVYSIILILGTLMLLKVYSLYMCIKLCKKCGKRNIRYSVVHSLSAFIIICYFHMLRTSIALVSCVEIKTYGNKKIKEVAMFDGGLECYSKEHLQYMIPAMISLTILSIPPLLLITEPLFLLVTSKIGLNMQFNCWTRIRDVFKPFLDSFQGCFKNNCRMFAGLFFVYRIALGNFLLTSNNSDDHYNYALVSLMVIVLIHAMVRPFEKEWHNKLDLYLLLTMLTVVFLSHLNATTSRVSRNLLVTCQVIISSVPFVLFTIRYIVKIIRKKCKNKNETDELDLVSQEVIFAKLESKVTYSYRSLD